MNIENNIYLKSVNVKEVWKYTDETFRILTYW